MPRDEPLWKRHPKAAYKYDYYERFILVQLRSQNVSAISELSEESHGMMLELMCDEFPLSRSFVAAIWPNGYKDSVIARRRAVEDLKEPVSDEMRTLLNKILDAEGGAEQAYLDDLLRDEA